MVGAVAAAVEPLGIADQVAAGALLAEEVAQAVLGQHRTIDVAGVADAARHGGPRLRRTSHHDDLFVRGRLDVPSTIRHRAGRRPLVGSIRTERDLDNPVARVLVLADRALRSLLPVRPTWRPTLTGEVLGQLRTVDPDGTSGVTAGGDGHGGGVHCRAFYWIGANCALPAELIPGLYSGART